MKGKIDREIRIRLSRDLLPILSTPLVHVVEISDRDDSTSQYVYIDPNRFREFLKEEWEVVKIVRKNEKRKNSGLISF